MIARLTRRLLVLQLLGVLAVASGIVFGLHRGWTVALSSGMLVLLFIRMAITANSFALAWRYHSITPQAHRLTMIETVVLFFTEFYASLWSSSWAMPFKAAAPSPLIQTEPPPVLLVHGYGCNSGYWHVLRKALTEAGIAHRAIDLEPLFADIEDYVPTIFTAVEEMCRVSGQSRIIVLAHSMGGLATRAYLRRHGAQRIARLITLGTPHHGTGIANFGVGMNCRQMHWRGNAQNGTPSAWLRKLDESEDAALRSLIVSIYSHHDNIVAPQTSSHLAGARNLAYHGIGHVALALHPLIRARVIAEILDASGQAVVHADPHCTQALAGD